MLKPGRAPSDEVIALLSRRLPPVRSSICLIAIAATAAGLLHPITASAATQPDHAARKAALVHHARKHAPAFHVDKTPLGADVTGAGTSAGTAPVAVGSAGADVIRTIVGLAVVLGVIYGVYWLLKSAARAKSGRADERIGVIATTPLAPNRSLHLVRAGDELILVGATDHSITPLRVYAAEEALQIEGAANSGFGAGDMAISLPPATPLRRNNLLENLRKRTARA
jgi:flagellar biosynthetic protein FliO